MKRWVAMVAAGTFAAGSALAALPVGGAAPDFEAPAAMNGEQFSFSLAEALNEGPVVLYFFPKAKTGGCDVQAYEFGQQAEAFAAHGARVYGVSADSIDTLKAYSADPETCAGKFAVISDADGRIMKAYDAVASANPANAAMADRLAGLADRTTYVIASGGEIVFTYSDLREPLAHVSGALQAVEALAGKHDSGHE